MSVRTLAAWELYSERTGEKDISNYLNVGDITTADLVYSLMGKTSKDMPPISYFQTAEPFDYCYDLAKILRPIFPTFAECDGIWRYCGHCFQIETVNRY